MLWGASSMSLKTIIEPFRIKSVEPIRMTTRSQREAILRAASFNLFSIRAGGCDHRSLDR